MLSLKFTEKEARGVLVLIIAILLVGGSRALYNYIVMNRLVAKMDAMPKEQYSPEDRLFEFDPNTVTVWDLRKMGLGRREAVSVIRYQEYGKVFRIKEDLLTCYGITDSIYFILEPYIVIGEKYRLKKWNDVQQESREARYATSTYRRKLLSPSPFLVDTVGVKYLVAIGAMTRRQAEVFVKWRNQSGMYTIDEFRECYVVSDSVATALQPYLIFTEYEEPTVELVNINKADSAELRSLYGVGEKSVSAILKYRKLLGGFYSVEQISELKVITESNYEKIIQQILCDSCDISKIDVNFATAKKMNGHPYIPAKALRRLIKIRELKGGWSTIAEMITDDIFTEEEATRVRPYLLFGEFSVPIVVDDESF